MLPSGGPYVALPFIKEVGVPFVAAFCVHEWMYTLAHTKKTKNMHTYTPVQKCLERKEISTSLAKVVIKLMIIAVDQSQHEGICQIMHRYCHGISLIQPCIRAVWNIAERHT